jgi:hypothetical protein
MHCCGMLMLLPPCARICKWSTNWLLVPAAVQGPVWQQLVELCDLSPLCAPARLRRQKEANKHLRSVNTQLCSDNKQLQSENAALRLQLQRSQANIQGQ